MKFVKENIFKIKSNTGKAFECFKGQRVKVEGSTIIDFVAFNLHDILERFDQARTKANQGKIFISTGDWLYSKRNNKMMQIVEDTFLEGHHDLQKGMCSRKRFELAVKQKVLPETYGGKKLEIKDLPDHGCWENLSLAVSPWNILPDDIPSPFNLFQDMHIDVKTGKKRNSHVRPKEKTHVIFLLAMDCLIAVSACPDITVGGKEIVLTIF